MTTFYCQYLDLAQSDPPPMGVGQRQRVPERFGLVRRTDQYVNVGLLDDANRAAGVVRDVQRHGDGVWKVSRGWPWPVSFR